MTSASLALEGPARVVERRRDRSVLAAWAVVVTGALLVAGALVLLALVERAGVPSSGHPSAGRVLVRILPGACMLLPGALMLAHLPRHPIGWILCAAGLGIVLAGASTAGVRGSALGRTAASMVNGTPLTARRSPPRVP